MGLENLFRMKDAHKRMQQKEDITHPVNDDSMDLGEHDRTLADIFQDKKEQDKFLNQFCYEQDPNLAGSVVTSLADGTVLTPEQNKFLEKMRKEFNLRTAEVEKVQEILPQYIGRISENDPRIQQVVGQIGPEAAAALLGKEFGSLAMSDTKNFRKVIKELRALDFIDKDAHVASLEQKVRASLSSHGISEEQYWEATRAGATGETQDKLTDLVAEQYGWFKKAVDYAMGGKLSREAGQKLYTDFETQTLVLKTVDKHMKAIGKVLQGTLNAEVNLAIQKAMLEGGEVDEKKLENNITTMDQYNAAKNDLMTTQTRWEKYRSEELQKRNIKDITKQPQILDELKTSFTEQEYQKRKGYRPSALFAALIALLTGGTTKDDIRNSLK